MGPDMKAYILVKSYICGKDQNMIGHFIGDVCENKQKAEELKKILMKNRESVNDVWFIVERDLYK